MYDTGSLIYTAVSFVVTALFCVLFRKAGERSRLNILRVIALLTLITHMIKPLYNFFADPGYLPGNDWSTMWPYYFCNFMMWMLPIAFCGPKVLKPLYPFVLWGSLWGGLITIAYPDFYNASNGIFSLGNFKSYLSHSLMILAFCYAVASGEYKPRVRDVAVFFAGLVGAMLWGFFSNWLFAVTGKSDSLNSMYLRASAIGGTPFNGYLIGILLTLGTALLCFAWEAATLPREERFTTKLRTLLERRA